MKIVPPKPTCSDRYPVRLLVPVAFDGNIIPTGAVVEVSDTQFMVMVDNLLCEAADETETKSARENMTIARTRAKIEFGDEGDSPRQRRRWRSRKRNAPAGSIRIDSGASITGQLRGFLSR